MSQSQRNESTAPFPGSGTKRKTFAADTSPNKYQRNNIQSQLGYTLVETKTIISSLQPEVPENGSTAQSQPEQSSPPITQSVVATQECESDNSCSPPSSSVQKSTVGRKQLVETEFRHYIMGYSKVAKAFGFPNAADIKHELYTIEFSPEGVEKVTIQKRLIKNTNIILPTFDIARRKGKPGTNPHFFTTLEHLAKLLEFVGKLLVAKKTCIRVDEHFFSLLRADVSRKIKEPNAHAILKDIDKFCDIIYIAIKKP